MPEDQPAVLILHEDVGDHCYETLKTRAMTQYGKLRIYNITADPASAPPIGYALARYLDNFYLVLPVDRTPERQDTLDLFFSWLAPRYELAIDVERNVRNIEMLFTLLDLSAGAIVLDFGCGTGLAYESAKMIGIELIGFDTCAVMRGIASTKGLRTITPDFLLTDDFLVDGVISSYVIHLRPAVNWIEAIWGHLRPGGRFVCNVHKGCGAQDFEDIMESLGATLTTFSDPIHGPYIVCLKASATANP